MCELRVCMCMLCVYMCGYETHKITDISCDSLTVRSHNYDSPSLTPRCWTRNNMAVGAIVQNLCRFEIYYLTLTSVSQFTDDKIISIFET